jgi:hypothetical protein
MQVLHPEVWTSGYRAVMEPCSRSFVEVAIPNNPDLDLITMKQVLVKAAELGNPELGA